MGALGAPHSSPFRSDRWGLKTSDTSALNRSGDPASRALRGAIDPLFHDVADRARLGEVEDFLFAAKTQSPSVDEIRAPIEVTFHLPPSLAWATTRVLSLRRFWFAHSNGAPSYHLSFSFRFSNSRDAETCIFLSLLQKLATPKESVMGVSGARNVFDGPIGIAPLDDVTVCERGQADHEPIRFWPFVLEKFLGDASDLLVRVLKRSVPEVRSSEGRSSGSEKNWARVLMDSTQVKLIEFPELQLPRNRSLFFTH